MTCRGIWFEHGSPSPKKCIDNNLLPPDENGNVVPLNSLKHWIAREGWYEWKDSMNAQLAVRVENELLSRKVELIKEQLAEVRVVRQASFEHLTEHPFDSSAAATSAFYKALQEERGLMQIEKVIEDLAKAQSSDLKKQFQELAERAGATDVIEEQEEDSAESLDT
jgi:hypothetical protein